jgi:2-dehydropantoate 2-reductase
MRHPFKVILIASASVLIVCSMWLALAWFGLFRHICDRYEKGEGVTAVMRDLVDECLAIAKADGVTIPGDVDAAVRKIAETVPGQYSSTAQDLARGKRSEIDHLNGLIVRRSEALGIATPANRLLHAIVKLIESK